MKKVLQFLISKPLYLGVARYVLGFIMMGYGLTKILGTQFVLLPVSVWQQQLESLPGTNIAWAFLGYSLWFQRLLGWFELVPALLLLFRRTTLLGAILILPMTLSVMLINYALDLWDATQLISVFLFSLNIVLLLLELKKIRQMMATALSWPATLRHVLPEATINIVLISAFLFFASAPLIEYRNEGNRLTGDWYNKHSYEWILSAEYLGDTLVSHRPVQAYFMAYGDYSEIRDHIPSAPGHTYALDTVKHLLTLGHEEMDKPLHQYSYLLRGDSILDLSETDTVKQVIHTLRFKRRVMNADR